MKSSASVKLLGRSSGVTSSCLAFELSTGRVTSASVVIEWWWHFMFWNIARGMKRSASVKLLGRGSGVCGVSREHYCPRSPSGSCAGFGT